MRRREMIDPMSIQAHTGELLQPSVVLERLKIRSDSYTNMEVGRVSSLGIHWSDEDNSHRTSGYYANIDGRDLPLTAQAMRSASALVRVKDVKHWEQFPDRDAFPKTLRHILEAPHKETSLQVRHDGLAVRAILPMAYKIKDSYELLSDFLQMITDSVGKIQGISVMESGTGDATNPRFMNGLIRGDVGDIGSYRVVINENIMPQLQAQFGQHMMFLLGASETGMRLKGGGSAFTALGCFRTICTNSAVRDALTSSWNHNDGKPMEKFYSITGDRIDQIGYFQDTYSKIFGELYSHKILDIEPSELLSALREQNLISFNHYEAAQPYIGMLTEDHRPIENQYDMFNVLTRAALDLPSQQEQQKAESRSLSVFTDGGGVFERLRKAHEKADKKEAQENPVAIV